jgi:pyrroline-5-carboxylate reductase
VQVGFIGAGNMARAWARGRGDPVLCTDSGSGPGVPVFRIEPGAAEPVRARGGDTLAVRREVISPRGTTARGPAALERGGVRAAFSNAMDGVVGG